MCYTSFANPNFLDDFEIDIANILSTSSLLLQKQLICLHIPTLNFSLMFWLDSSVLQSLHIINTVTRISVNTSAWDGLSLDLFSLEDPHSEGWEPLGLECTPEENRGAHCVQKPQQSNWCCAPLSDVLHIPLHLNLVQFWISLALLSRLGSPYSSCLGGSWK